MRGRDSANKARNEAKKAARRMRHAERRRKWEMGRDDRKRYDGAFESHGMYGTKSCGRKKRYESYHQAHEAAIRCSREMGRIFYEYRCPLGCGGWHIASHKAKERNAFLKPSEIFQNARWATMRIRDIEAEKIALEERLGPQGHSYGFTSKNDIRDPMRHVDARIDATAELDAEKAELKRDVRDAWRLVAGISEQHVNGDEAAQLIVEYYIEAKSLSEIAESTTYPEKINLEAIRMIVDWCDSVGVARLRSSISYE